MGGDGNGTSVCIALIVLLIVREVPLPVKISPVWSIKVVCICNGTVLNFHMLSGFRLRF